MTHLTGQERATYVQEMFDRLAGRYDLMNRLITFGQDLTWRRFVVRQARLQPGQRLLDLATGTGDIALEARKSVRDLQVVGGDFALKMMFVGQRRAGGDQIGWTGADALRLPFPDVSFDAVTSGYLVRNVIDIPATFREQLRVLKPGGRIVVLDSSPPPRNLLRPFILIHMKYIIPLLGRMFGSDPSAYQYLPDSTQAFKSPEELAAIMRAAGVRNVQFRTFMFGTNVVHWGEK